MINIELPQKVILGLCISLFAFVLFFLAYSFYQWYADWKLAHVAIAKVERLSVADDKAIFIATLPNMHLFGQSDMTVPITNLRLQVTGIVKRLEEKDNEFSKAYISIADQPSKIYQIGDSLPYGVKVHAITPDAVILENDGRLEKLLLPREKLLFKSREETHAN